MGSSACGLQDLLGTAVNINELKEKKRRKQSWCVEFRDKSIEQLARDLAV